MKRLLKINSATCLLELQQVLYVEGLTLKVDHVTSAGAWRATLQRNGEAQLWIGLGRTIGEAVENGVSKYEAER